MRSRLPLKVTLIAAALAGPFGCVIHEGPKESCATDGDCLAGRSCSNGICATSTGSGSNAPPDAQAASDAAMVTPDAAMVTPDAAMVTPDAAMVTPDAAPDVTPDATPDVTPNVPDVVVDRVDPVRPPACDDPRPGSRIFFTSVDHLRTTMTGRWAFCVDGTFTDIAVPETYHALGIEILIDQQWSLLNRNERGEVVHDFGYDRSGVYQFVEFNVLPPLPQRAVSHTAFDERFTSDAGAADPDAWAPPPPLAPDATVSSSGAMATVRFGDGIHSVSAFDSPTRLVFDGRVAVPWP